MEDGVGAQALPLLWINWTEQIVSFRKEDGYERLEFPSDEEKLEYAFEKTSNGFRIQ